MRATPSVAKPATAIQTINERDEAGRLTAFKGTRKGDGRRESFIHIYVAGMEDSEGRAEVVHALEGVLARRSFKQTG